MVSSSPATADPSSTGASHAIANWLYHAFFLYSNYCELSGPKGSKADVYVDDALVDVVVCGGLFVAIDQVGVAGIGTLKCPLVEEAVKKGAHSQAYLRP